MEKIKLIKEIKFPGIPIHIEEKYIENEIIITHAYRSDDDFGTRLMLRGVLRAEDGDEIPYIQPYELKNTGETNV